MSGFPRSLAALLPGLFVLCSPSAAVAADYDFLGAIKLPPGFSISLYADQIPGARMMAVASNGDLFVSAMGAGKILVLERDRDGGGKPDGRSEYITGLRSPHGVAFGKDDYFYFAEDNQVSRVPYLAGDLQNRHRIQTIVRNLPVGGHSTKTVIVGPDDKLYISVGSSCNVCLENDKRRATIMRFDPVLSRGEVFASGLRNAVGLAFHPRTGHLYATVNGRDMLGGDFPPDTLNRVTEGSFHGWPFASGDRVPDPDFGKGHEKEIASMVLPEVKFQAHSAALGISFYDPPAGTSHPFPNDFRQDAFVAFHGSWNRREPTGYKVVRVIFDDSGKGTGYEDFATGWLSGGKVHGRPVSVQPAPDGSLFVTDDLKGCVYRISYRGSGQAGAGETTATTESKTGERPRP